MLNWQFFLEFSFFFCGLLDLLFSNVANFMLFEYVLSIDIFVFMIWWIVLFKYKCPIVLQNGRITDTSSAQARRGIDIQGIPWDRLSITREKYRQTRLEQYKNYENIPNSGELSLKVWDLLLYPVFMSILHRNSSQAQLVPLGIQTDQEGGIILRLLVQYKICQINHPSFSGEQRWDLVNMLAFCFYWPNTLFDSLKFWFIFHVRAILLK